MTIKIIVEISVFVVSSVILIILCIKNNKRWRKGE